jgi:hypothetical protein
VRGVKKMQAPVNHKQPDFNRLRRRSTRHASVCISIIASFYRIVIVRMQGEKMVSSVCSDIHREDKLYTLSNIYKIEICAMRETRC